MEQPGLTVPGGQGLRVGGGRIPQPAGQPGPSPTVAEQGEQDRPCDGGQVQPKVLITVQHPGDGGGPRSNQKLDL